MRIPALLCLASALAAPLAAQDITRDPAAVRLEVGDLRRLASSLRAVSGGDTLAALRQYLAGGSPGLRAYTERYSLTADGILAAMRANPRAYRDLDRLADAVLAQDSALRAAFRSLRDVFPSAAFPPVWFVAGNRGPGGMVRPEGVIVAAERFVDRPQDVVPLVLHELAHFQSAMVQGVETYQRIYGPAQTLLAVSLREGTAEFIAELTAGRHINPAAERYGTPREAGLWAEFRDAMHGRDTGEWMFVRPADAERPPDLGYWMGYRIARAYYERAADKTKAVADMIALTDFPAFLAVSGYAPGGG